jgi:hypothetical protein
MRFNLTEVVQQPSSQFGEARGKCVAEVGQGIFDLRRHGRKPPCHHPVALKKKLCVRIRGLIEKIVVKPNAEETISTSIYTVR